MWEIPVGNNFFIPVSRHASFSGRWRKKHTSHKMLGNWLHWLNPLYSSVDFSNASDQRLELPVIRDPAWPAEILQHLVSILTSPMPGHGSGYQLCGNYKDSCISNGNNQPKPLLRHPSIALRTVQPERPGDTVISTSATHLQVCGFDPDLSCCLCLYLSLHDFIWFPLCAPVTSTPSPLHMPEMCW